MNKLPEISEAEHQVMKVVWNDNPTTAMEIIEELSRITDWKPNTIKTFINRLLKKGALGYAKTGKEYNYYPLIEESDFVKSESRSFLNRIFGGSLIPMLVTLVENEDLTLEDIEDLRSRILEKKQEV